MEFVLTKKTFYDPKRRSIAPIHPHACVGSNQASSHRQKKKKVVLHHRSKTICLFETQPKKNTPPKKASGAMSTQLRSKRTKSKARTSLAQKSHGKLSAQGALPLDVAHIVNDLQKREQPDKKKKPDKNNLTKKSAALHFT